jgi:hypothetical protein
MYLNLLSWVDSCTEFMKYCKNEKYKSVAFLIISGLHLKPANSSRSCVLDELKSFQILEIEGPVTTLQ